MKRFTLVFFAVLLFSLAVSCAMAQGLQNVELHGYMLNRMYASPDQTARFVTERVSLSAVGQLGKDGTAYAEVYFHPWMPDTVSTTEQYRTYLESAYLDLPLMGGRIRIGKGRQLNFGMTPTYPNRKTTQYGILSETFTQDRIQGFQFDKTSGKFDIGVSAYTDQDLGTRAIGDYSGVAPTMEIKHIVDKDIPGELSTKMAVSGRAGISTPCFSMHLSGATGKLTQTNATNVMTAAGIAGTASTDHNKYGADAQYSFGKMVAQGEWYTGKFSLVKITGYSLLLGYQPKDSRRVYVRYAAINNDITPTDKQLTWPTEQLTFGVVQPIRKGVWAELNYEKNMERTGAGAQDVDNDILFLEFFSGF